MPNINRRGLGNAVLALSAVSLVGCSKLSTTLATVESDVKKVTATIATDAATLISQYGIAKGIGQVALAALEITNPAAAAIISEGITLVEAWVSAGNDTVEANASQIVSTTNDIIAAAAPAIQVVQNATSQAAVASTL